MQVRPTSSVLAGVLLVGAWLLPAALAAEETDAPAAAAEISAEEAEEREQLRRELEQKEAARAQARQQICEQARAELQRMGDLPPRRFMYTNEQGEVVRMNEEEHRAHLDRLRAAEAENCR
jgi:thioesterase domain-containing protein